MDDGRRERRGPPFSPLFPLPIAPSALSFFPLPSPSTTQREESPQVTVPCSSVPYLSSMTQGQFVGSGETSFCRAVSQDPTHCPWVSDDVWRERFVVRAIRQYQKPTKVSPRRIIFLCFFFFAFSFTDVVVVAVVYCDLICCQVENV